jgi:hypothetical protein
MLIQMPWMAAGAEDHTDTGEPYWPAGVAQAAERRVHPDAGESVESAEGLVGGEELGLSHQGSGVRAAWVAHRAKAVGRSGI